MRFQLIGVNHKSAPVEIRERLAIPESQLAEACRKLGEHPEVEEGMIISTCNRVEVIASTKNGTAADLRGFLHRYFQLAPEELEKHLYEYRENEAVRHVFRVASSLDSMVKGEPQILGQIKNAYSVAAQSKACGLLLNKLLHRAFHVAKRVRTETRIGNSAVSVSFVAVELAKKIFGALENKTVLLIGAGGRQRPSPA